MIARYVLIMYTVALMIACGGGGLGISRDFKSLITATNKSIASLVLAVHPVHLCLRFLSKSPYMKMTGVERWGLSCRLSMQRR